MRSWCQGRRVLLRAQLSGDQPAVCCCGRCCQRCCRSLVQYGTSVPHDQSDAAAAIPCRSSGATRARAHLGCGDQVCEEADHLTEAYGHSQAQNTAGQRGFRCWGFAFCVAWCGRWWATTAVAMEIV